MKPKNSVNRSASLTRQRAVGPPPDQGRPALRRLNDQGQDMCKNGALTGNGKDKNQNAETVNVGLINSSSTSFNEVPIWEIVEILSLLILGLLVVRWIRKYFIKRKLVKQAEQFTKQARHMAQVAAHMRPANMDMEMQHTRQIQHRQASLTELPIEAAQQAINPPTIGAYDQYR